MLAFACAFTMFAGAAFTDDADIVAKEAVDMLASVEVIDGFSDGSFKPDAEVTRAQMAKMIFVVRNNTADDAAYASVPTKLNDIQGHWAAGAIKFNESQGIIGGYGTGKFLRDNNVTGVEAAKMLLVLAGYEPEKAGLTGANWKTNTLKHAGAAGLLSGVNAPLEQNLPRQYAAQMIYNALSTDRVIWSEDSQRFDNVLNGGAKETVGRAYMGLYTSVGTLVGVDLDEVHLANVDENESDAIDTVWDGSDRVGQYASSFSKVTTEYSELIGQKVKVLFKDGKTNQVMSVYAMSDNTVYTVAANQTEKDDDKVKFDGTSYRLDDKNGIKTYVDGVQTGATTLDQLDNNALNPNMYTFVDSNDNGRLDTLVVKTYNVAKVSYAASDKIIANGQTYKTADENIEEGLAKDDWVVITRNMFEDCWDIEKAEMQSGTLTGLRDSKSNTGKNIYFDGGAVEGDKSYNEYQIDGTWFKGGDKLVQNTKLSQNDLKSVNAGDSVEYVAVNGIMFYIKRTSDGTDGMNANVAMLLMTDEVVGTKKANIALFDGSKTVVDVDSDSVSELLGGTVYEYFLSVVVFLLY